MKSNIANEEMDAIAAQKASTDLRAKEVVHRDEANPSRGTSHTIHTQQSIFSPGQESNKSQLS